MLYRIVKEYSDFGAHRTGTDVDNATQGWFASHLHARGAEVSRQEYPFEFFVGRTRVTLDGCEIPSMPLYYEYAGSVKTDKVAIAEFGDGEHGSGLDEALEKTIDSATNSGFDALVIATRGETGDLVAINCEPELRGRIPVILVPGRYADALATGKTSIEYHAQTEPRVSANLTGHWPGRDSGPPFVITTPLSGWFNCAGERGTGIAVALQVAESLADRLPHIPLQVIAPSGHELGFHGAWRVAETINAPPRAVLHLGSCIAARDAQLQGVVHADPSTSEAISKALAPIDVIPAKPANHLDPGCWVGESQCWAALGMPMLSIAGVSPLFHTPRDTAEAATTPELLRDAAECVTKAALALAKDR